VGSARNSEVAGDKTANVRLGGRLREARRATGVSVRELARRVQVSPSFISQIELGRAAPSIGTLYAVASELGLSLDALMNDVGQPANGDAREAPVEAAEPAVTLVGDAADGEGPSLDTPVRAHEPPLTSPPSAFESGPRAGQDGSPSPSPVQRGDRRPTLKLGDVTWERLTADDDPHVEFLRITYPPGTESCTADNLMHHNGWEYGHVLSGALDVQVSFRTETVRAGDSIDFNSTRPHRFSNPYGEPCVAIWVVVGRQQRS
jgi:transcriptional regulator with XRE-family HTH domain/mannose-6-phosphate isomerase-like protein (cupin superfamily)